MALHVAFLRAINVGGRRVSNDQLAGAVRDAGFEKVSTYLASGNVIYDAGDATPEASAAAVEVAVEQALGFASEAFVRTAADLETILAAEPFDPDLIAQATSAPQVAFLRAPLPPDVARDVEALATPTDHLVLIGRELHWLPMAGQARAALDTRALERLVGASTIRSRTTIARILPRLG